MKRKCPVDLPEDLVAEILSRVPATSLARFRSTSKRWNALISKDARFAKKHFANSPRQYLVIMLIKFSRVCLVSVDLCGIHNNVAPSAKVTCEFNLKDPLYNSPNEEVNIRDIFHCDGLLLCSTLDNRLVVWNPFSRETKWIQPRNSYKDSDRYALGYDKKLSCYKILRINQYGNGIKHQTEDEVYDFTSNSWRVVCETRDWFILPFNGRGVSVKGNAYWPAYRTIEGERTAVCFLLSFDFSAERFQSQSFYVSPPLSVLTLSVARDEKLCLLTRMCVSPLVLDLWVETKSETAGATPWSKVLTAQTNFKFSLGMSFVTDEQNKVVVCCDHTSFPDNILQIVAEDRCLQVRHNGAECGQPLLLSYVPTLVRIP